MAYTRTTWRTGETPLSAGNMNNIEDGIEEALAIARQLTDRLYPVGCYFETSDTTFDPNNTWGGTWVLETAGVVHVSSGTGYAVNHANDNSGVGAKDGGASTVTLTSAQSAMPAHHHGLNGHTHGLNGHTHSLNNHAHGIGRALGVTAGSWAGDSAGALSGSGHKYAYVDDSTSNAIQTITSTGGNSGNTGGSWANTGGNSGNTTDASVATASQAHENMPPYINVNRWHRIA